MEVDAPLRVTEIAEAIEASFMAACTSAPLAMAADEVSGVGVSSSSRVYSLNFECGLCVVGLMIQIDTASGSHGEKNVAGRIFL